jgi:hypothetical protein|tara:strand:- start:2549 stop:2965 length:417 start_codon:yes stop_codon:yes gene_type:complete
MAPKFDPWNPPRHGSPRKESPAFQREWKPVESSGVLIDNVASQTIIEPASSVNVSGTIYLWGLSFGSQDTLANGGTVTDDNGNVLTVALGNAQGPSFLQLSTPIRVTANSGVVYNALVYKAGSYITPYYTVSTEPYEA